MPEILNPTTFLLDPLFNLFTVNSKYRKIQAALITRNAMDFRRFFIY